MIRNALAAAFLVALALPASAQTETIGAIVGVTEAYRQAAESRSIPASVDVCVQMRVKILRDDLPPALARHLVDAYSRDCPQR